MELLGLGWAAGPLPPDLVASGEVRSKTMRTSVPGGGNAASGGAAGSAKAPVIAAREVHAIAASR